MKRLFLIVLFLPFITCGQIINTIAGGGTTGLGDGGQATAASFTMPQCLAYDKFGNLYIDDATGNRIRKVTPAGFISTIAGPGTTGLIGDGGPATNGWLQNPEGVTCDTFGNVFISDRNNYRIRKVDVSTGIITTIAGTGVNVFSGSGDGGPATSACFNTPADLKFDKKGNLYIADNSASNIRIINTSGLISTYSGTGMPGFSGDGGPATAALIRDVRYLAFDDIGNLYLSEDLGARIRKVDTDGIITTIAGTGSGAYNGDSISATSTNMRPQGIVFFNNALYVSTLDNRIRKIDFSSDSNYVYTIAGTGVGAFNGDGILADTAELFAPGGITVQECGNIIFNDVENSRVREIASVAGPLVPTISLSGTSTFVAGHTVTVTATVANAGYSYNIHWMNHGIQFASTTLPLVTYTKGTGIDTITAMVIPVVNASFGCYDSTTSAKHIVTPDLSVNQLGVTGSINMFPNPASNFLYITGKFINSVSIENCLGLQVYLHEFYAPQAEIDISGLSCGLYFVKVNGSEVRKLEKR